jgi:uncharacterized membrane protein YedE/YeeE
MDILDTLFPLGMMHYIIGGLLIGAGVSLLFILTGLIGGMSTVYSSVWSYTSKISFFQQPAHKDSRVWRLVYALGLILGAAAWFVFSDTATTATSLPWWQLALGGFIAGFGARYGNGCTSGHGICGMASLSLPSFLSVLVFLSTAIVTAQLFSAINGAI